MKFFSTALAAFMAGSALAAPVLDANTVSAPCPCSGNNKPGSGSGSDSDSGVQVPSVSDSGSGVQVPSVSDSGSGVQVPSVSLPVPCTSTALSTATGLPVSIGGDGHEVSHDNGAPTSVVVVVQTVVEVAVEVEAKVKAELELIAKIIATADIDAQALLKVLVDLKVDLDILKACVPKLNGLVIDADVIVAADLQIILELVARIEALVAEVEVCLKGLVVLKAEVLAVIGVQLHLCLNVIVSITAPVVKFALAVVAKLTAIVELKVILGQISTCAGNITNTCNGLQGLLAPVFQLVHL